MRPLQVLALVLAASAAGATSADTQPVPGARDGASTVERPSGVATPAAHDIAVALRASRKRQDGGDKLVAQIARAASSDLDALLDILFRGAVPQVAADDAPQILSAPQRGLALAALASLPTDRVRTAIDRRLRADSTLPVRVAVVRCLGAIGSAGDLARMIELAPRRDDGSFSRDNGLALREAATSLLARDPVAIAQARSLLHTTDRHAAEELLFAVGERRDPRLLAILLDVAATRPELGQQVVALVRIVGPSASATIDHDFCTWAARELASARPDYARGILQALGELDDGAFVPVILEQLEEEDTGVRDSALWSLKKITGLALAPQADPWKAWWADQQRWMQRDRPRLVQAIRSGSFEHALDALRAFGDRRVFQAELARDVALAFERDEPELKRLACESLARLKSPAALESLCDHLDDEDTAVAEGAWKALCSISGQDLPRSRAEARAQLGFG